MAEAKNVSFEGIMRDLEAGKFAPVYYLMGDEPYYIDKIADYIAEHALQPEERDFNQTILFGSDVNASQIADQNLYKRCFYHTIIALKYILNTD